MEVSVLMMDKTILNYLMKMLSLFSVGFALFGTNF